MFEFRGMPPGFAELIAKKYAQTQFGLDTSRIATNASANLENVRASVVVPESNAQIAELGARTRNLGLTGATIIPEANSRIGLNYDQGLSLRAGVRQSDAETEGITNMNRTRRTSSFLSGGGGMGGYGGFRLGGRGF